MKKKVGNVIPLFGNAKPMKLPSIREQRESLRKDLELEDNTFFNTFEKLTNRFINKKSRD